MCGDNSTLAHTLSKIPRLHFDRVDVQVRNVDVTSPQAAFRVGPALVIGRQVVAKVLPCFPLDR
jgi:hypothetical protein